MKQALFSWTCFVNLSRWRVRWAERFFNDCTLFGVAGAASWDDPLPACPSHKQHFVVQTSTVFFLVASTNDGKEREVKWQSEFIHINVRPARQKLCGTGIGTGSAKVARQRHESGSCFTTGGGSRSVSFVFQPNKEGQVGRPSFCSTSVFLVWEEVSKNREAVLRCGTSHLRMYCWSTWLHMLPGLILDLPQTPHGCLSL